MMMMMMMMMMMGISFDPKIGHRKYKNFLTILLAHCKQPKTSS